MGSSQGRRIASAKERQPKFKKNIRNEKVCEKMSEKNDEEMVVREGGEIEGFV